MSATIPKFQGVIRPRTYNWIGTADENMYWDDPNNWAEGAYPDHPEATAVFADALTRNVNVILRKDVFVANLWFSEQQHSYTIRPEGRPDVARLLFQTREQSALFHQCRNRSGGNDPVRLRVQHAERDFLFRQVLYVN